MTLAISSPEPTPAPTQGGRDPQWIDLDEASKRSGRSVGHIARLCRTVWQFKDAARLMRPENGGKPAWHVREDADVCFARVKSPDQLSAAYDAKDLTPKQQAMLRQRDQVRRDWLAARDGGSKMGFAEKQVTEQFISRLEADRGLVLSRRTLFNWERAYRARGLAGLVDERWQTLATSGGAKETPFLDELRRLYLDQRKRSKARCYDCAIDAAREHRWEIPSYRSACRFLEAIPVKVTALHRGGAETFANTAARHIERDYTTIDSNDIWIGDHHRLDVQVDVGGGKTDRPWLTAWMDMRSRLIVGWRLFAHDPNSDTILGAFYDAAHPDRNNHGVPNGVYIDNGKDYDSYTLQGQTKKQRQRGETPQPHAGVFRELGIKIQHARPNRPQGKTIERFFGTLASRFSTLWETYCGNSPANRPEDHADRVAAGRAPKMEEFVASFTDWLDAEYHVTAHEGDGMNGQSPADVYAANLHKKRTLPAGMFDVMLLRQTPPLVVGRNGVRYKGLNYGREERELWAMLGKQVTLRVDDRDLKKVKVFSIEGRWICDAAVNTKLPVNADSQLLRQASAEMGRDKKLARDFIQKRPRMADSLSDRLYRKAAERRAKQPPPDPQPNIQPIQTPVEGAFGALQEAMQRTNGRVAVGGESFNFDDVSTALRNQQQASGGGDDESDDTFDQLGAAMRLADDEETE